MADMMESGRIPTPDRIQRLSLATCLIGLTVLGLLESADWKQWVAGRLMAGDGDIGAIGILAAGHRFGRRSDGDGIVYSRLRLSPHRISSIGTLASRLSRAETQDSR